MKISAPVHDVVRVADLTTGQREAVEIGSRGESRPSPEPRQIDVGNLDQVVDKMNAAADLFNKALQFKVLEGNRIIIKVVDTTNGEVLSEFPPEKLIEAFRSMETSLGLLVDKKV